jgi:hypothetical protein
MATASVSITFEATSTADAEAKIAGWSLHEGCQVRIDIIEEVKSSTGVINSDGDLVSSQMSETSVKEE